MAKQTEVLNFSARGSAKTFDLVQKPWAKKNPGKFSEWLEENKLEPTGGALFAAWAQYNSACDADGDLAVTLQVRLADIATPFALRASHGTLSSDAKLVETTRQEFLKFELATEASVDFGTIIAASWNGTVWNDVGDIVTDPPKSFSRATARTEQKIYGVLEVSVHELHYEYTLTIPPRTPTAEQVASDDDIYKELYGSTAFLFCGGRIVPKDIEMPENFGTCSGGYSGGVEFPEDPDEPEAAEYAVIFEIFDICKGTLLPDAFIVVDGKSVTPGETVILASGDYAPIVGADGYTQNNLDKIKDNDQFDLPRVSKK